MRTTPPCPTPASTSARRAAEPLRGGALYTGTPWKMSRTPAALTAPIPNRGEHDDEVYGELLGLDAAARAELREAGII